MMQREALFDIDVLHQVEQVCRERLKQEPGDMGARSRLAWCLFILALYQSGKDSMARNGAADPQQSAAEEGNSASSAYSLLKESLHQTFTIQHLSVRPEDVQSAQNLQELVKFSGGEKTIREAEEHAMAVLTTIIHEIRCLPSNSASRNASH